MSAPNQLFPAEPGSYLLWLYLPKGTELQIGRLGSFHFQRGWYLYCGSAFGPGGLRARLLHHLRPPRRTHWHVDYLRQVAAVRQVWLACGHNDEHLWSSYLLRSGVATAPVAGFGASDCRCLSHLLWLPRRPALRTLKKELEACGMSKIKSIRKIEYLVYGGFPDG